MSNIVRLYSTNSYELNIFLNKFYEFPIHLKNSHYWENLYSNPIELADIVAAFIDNNDVYSHVNMWISIDSGVFINIRNDNYNSFIKYLYERYPY